MSEKDGKKIDIEIVSDNDGATLDISPLYENINTVQPKDEGDKPKNIVIPKEKNKDTKK